MPRGSCLFCPGSRTSGVGGAGLEATPPSIANFLCLSHRQQGRSPRSLLAGPRRRDPFQPPDMRTFVRMRWDNLSVERERGAALPGFKEPAEVARPSWNGDHVALGTNTDPYEWVEGRYELMQGIWEAMRDFANPCSVLTKSPLLLRDVGLMKEIAERTDFTANLSIPTLDEKAWRQTEPHTPHPRKRIEAVAELKRAGIRTGVLIAPLIPGVNDSPEQVAPLLDLLDEAGPDSVGGVALHLRGEVREIWFDWLREHRPDLLPRYGELYERGAYMRKDEAGRLAAMVRRPGRDGPRRGIRARPDAERAEELSPPPERQPTLF